MDDHDLDTGLLAANWDLEPPGRQHSSDYGRTNSRLVSFDGIRGVGLGFRGTLTPSSSRLTLDQYAPEVENITEEGAASLNDIKANMFAEYGSGGGEGNFIERMLGVDSSSQLDKTKPLLPQMFNFHYVGLFSHYAGVGITGGMLTVASNFCFYYYHGADNVCANAASLMAVAWGFKLFFGIGTDMWRPFNSRRKVYMIVGWTGVLVMTFVLAVFKLEASTWIGVNLVSQVFLMVADVPADGYCVEIGQLERPEERGQVLATGQRLRFVCTILGGVIQAFLVNGPTTNPPNCPIDLLNCWAWGLTPNGYYGLVLCILFVLCLPIFFLKELPAHGPPHTFADHKRDIWITMQNPTTLYLIVFVVGNNVVSSLINTVASFVSYRIVKLSNFQSGISSILSGGALVGGIWIFQRYFIRRNWRYTQYLSTMLSATLGLVWLPVFYDLGGIMNPWFIIFLTCTVMLSAGIAQVLFAMAVIELAKKGQEATTYELIISTANSAGMINGILSTQLLTPLHANVCSAASGVCPSGAGVNLYSKYTYFSTDGPSKFTRYALLVFFINVVGIVIFTPFLPRQKDQCAVWRDQDYKNMPPRTGIFAWYGAFNDWFVGDRLRVAYASLAISVVVIFYQMSSTIAFLNPSFSCSPIFGGAGCK